MPVLAFDLGGTKFSGAIVDLNGSVLRKSFSQLEKRKGDEVGSLIVQQVRELMASAKAEGIRIEGAGICVPGISYTGTGRVWAPNIPGWDNYPLGERMREAIPSEIPVVIESDRSCYVQGEVWKGNAQGCRNAIFLAVGTGIGAGILADGRVIRGGRDIAGAIGWLALDRPFDEKYVSCGCFEFHASGEGIAKVAREFLAEDNSYNGALRKKSPDEISSKDVFEAYDAKDSLAVKVLNQAIEFWGMASANLVSLFNPEKIIFGGGVFGPAIRFLDDIYREAKRWAQPISITQVSFVPSALAGDAGLIGAASFAADAARDSR